MCSIKEALKLDSDSRKTRKARKAAEAFEKAYDKALDAEMEDILARGEAYSAHGAESASPKSLTRQKREVEFYARRSLVLAEEMMALQKRRLLKGVAHGAAFATTLGGTIAVTVGSHGLLAPLLALLGAVLTWAVADSAVERKKRRTLRDEMRQPAPGALELYLKQREGEDEDEDEDKEDQEELGNVMASYQM